MREAMEPAKSEAALNRTWTTCSNLWHGHGKRFNYSLADRPDHRGWSSGTNRRHNLAADEVEEMTPAPFCI